VSDEQGRHLAEVFTPDLTASRDEGATNAEYIVRAVNSHEVLLAACEDTLARLLFLATSEAKYYDRTNETWIEQLRAAIALAKGEGRAS
jgi:hypothetical protein